VCLKKASVPVPRPGGLPAQHAAAHPRHWEPAGGPFMGGARRRADLLADNPFNTLKLGCDFLRHHALPQIDFATAHLCALGAVRLCSFARERRTAPTKT